MGALCCEDVEGREGSRMIAWELRGDGTFILGRWFASSMLFSSVSCEPGHPMLTR